MTKCIINKMQPNKVPHTWTSTSMYTIVKGKNGTNQKVMRKWNEIKQKL